MKFIRQIIISLALLAVFIVLSIFSTTEYTEEKTDLNNTEDKLPGVNIILSKLSDILSYSNKIPALNLLPVAKNVTDIETKVVTDVLRDVKNNSNIKEKTPAEVIDTTKNTISEINLSDLFKKIKEVLFKDWSQS